jgi:hypothetical protein
MTVLMKWDPPEWSSATGVAVEPLGNEEVGAIVAILDPLVIIAKVDLRSRPRPMTITAKSMSGPIHA